MTDFLARIPARARRILQAALCALVCALAIALVRDTRYQGQDFEVFWRAGGRLLAGEPLYDLARDRAMAFKYPPWIATLFLPFALLPLTAAKWAWGVVGVGSLALVLRSLLLWGVPRARLGIAALLFWGIWAVHALDGQIMLPLLAVIWCGYRTASLPFRAALSSAKGVTALALLSEARDAKGIARVAGYGAIGVLLLSLPLFILLPGTPADWMGGWWEAAGSGAREFGIEKVLGRENQSVTALFLRGAVLFGADPEAWTVPLTVILSAAGGAFWWMRARSLPEEVRLAGWLALVPLVHPLPWFHGFTWAFPLAALSLRHAPTGMLPWLGITLVAVVTRKTLGSVGLALELASIKSWGVILLAWGLFRGDFSRRR